MGSQQRNVLLSTRLPIKSGGGYFMKSNTETENHYTKYMDNLKKKNNKKKKRRK